MDYIRLSRVFLMIAAHVRLMRLPGLGSIGWWSLAFPAVIPRKISGGLSGMYTTFRVTEALFALTAPPAWIKMTGLPTPGPQSV